MLTVIIIGFNSVGFPKSALGPNFRLGFHRV